MAPGDLADIWLERPLGHRFRLDQPIQRANFNTVGVIRCLSIPRRSLMQLP
jgi:hypothetical protein